MLNDKIGLKRDTAKLKRSGPIDEALPEAGKLKRRIDI
jgi:hypothetical protein